MTIAYKKTSLTGGGSGALDGIDGDVLNDGDFAFVIQGINASIYNLDADSGETETVPSIISPDDNAGTKRWVLQSVLGGYTRYVVDASETDQGVAGDGASLKDLIDSIGASKKATIALPHNGLANTTTYTLTTSESVPANIMLDIGHGAIIDGAGTLTLDNPQQLKADMRQKIFGSSLTIAFTNDGTVYPEWWGENTTPKTTDMTDMLQAAFDTGQNVVVPKGDYKFTTKLTINTSYQTVDFQQALLYPSGDIDGIEIGEQGDVAVKGFIKVYGININQEGASTKTSVIVSQVHHCEIHIDQSIGYDTNLELRADYVGCSYNQLYLDRLWADTYNIELTPSGDGYVTDNIFWGGSLKDNGSDLTYCVYSPTRAGTYPKPQNNKYIGTSFEPDQANYAIEDGGQFSLYLWPYIEGTFTTDGKPIHFNSDSYQCAYIGMQYDDPVTDNGSLSMEMGVNTIHSPYGLEVGIKSSTNPIAFAGISAYADNAAAVSAGLAVGDVYRIGDTLAIVHA